MYCTRTRVDYLYPVSSSNGSVQDELPIGLPMERIHEEEGINCCHHGIIVNIQCIQLENLNVIISLSEYVDSRYKSQLGYKLDIQIYG